MWRRRAAFSPPLPPAPTDSNNGKPPPGSSAIRRADAADMRRISGKRGKPGGDSAGEKSPLLPGARPPSAGRVADESAAQGSLFAGRHAVRPFLCRALSAVGQDRHERAFGRVSSFGHPPRAAAAARDASGIRFPGGGTASRCGRMFTGAREYPAFCSPGQLRRAFRRRLAASFSPLSRRRSGVSSRFRMSGRRTLRMFPLSRCACRMRAREQRRRGPRGQSRGGLLTDEDA